MMTNKKNIKICAGIDDATKCPCIGSIFVSGVVADRKTVAYWKKLGIKDSKLVAPKKRFKLASIIKETASAFSIKEITPARIDDKNLNLNDWEMLTVFDIVHELQKTCTFNIVHVDNWEVTEQCFKNRFLRLTSHTIESLLATKNIAIEKSKLPLINFIAEHHADELYTIVGAASILSKTSSDEQYQQYKQEFGNFGSGSPADPQTRLFVFNHRHNPPHIIRKSWNTYKTIAPLKTIENDPIYMRNKNKRSKNNSSLRRSNEAIRNKNSC